jgi:PAS domain S-box-containing protein
MNKSFNLLLIVLLVFLTGVFLEEMINSSKLSHYESLEETFEIIPELFSVFVALSIFGLTWYAYNKSRDNQSLFLGTTFLITGLLILCHLLSYPFMPDFITPNSPHKAAIFLLTSRFILAFLLLASVYVHKDSFPKLINKYVMVLFTISILSVSLASMLFYHDFLFMGFDLDSYSTVTVLLLFVNTIIILFTVYLYKKTAKETVQFNYNYLVNGSIIVLISNLVYFSYELPGHFLIITGFFYFYLGLYKTSIELPYERLAISEEKLRGAAEEKYRTLYDNSSDAIMLLDEKGFFDCNNATLEIFGYSIKEDFLKMTPAQVSPQYQRDGTDSYTAASKKIAEALKNGTNSFEWIHRRQNGENFSADILLTALNFKGKRILQATVRDISKRKQMENALHESEDKFEKAFLSSPQSLAITGLDSGLFMEVNDSFTKTLGYSRDEALGHTSLELGIWIIPEDRIRFNNALQENGFVHNVEVEIQTKNGDATSMLVSAELIDVARKACVLHTFYDITERKRAETALRENEEKYHTLVENANEAIVVLQDGWIKFANRRATELTGYSQRELMIMPFQGFAHPDDRNGVIENYKKRMKGEIVPGKYSFRILTIKGIAKWVEIGVTLIEWKGKPATLNFLADITQRKQNEETIKKLQVEQQIMLDNVPAWIFFKDTNNTFIRVNKVFAKVMNMSPEQLVGKSVNELYPREQAEAFWKDDLEIIESGNPKLNIIESVNIEGQTLWVQTDKIPYKDNTGNIIGIIGFTLDITQRKKAELEYKTILKTAMDGFYVADSQGHILDVNESYCSLIGYCRDELLSMRVKDVEAVESEEISQQRIAKISNVGWGRYETSNKCKDGRLVRIEASVNYIGIGRGKFYVFIRDITERTLADVKIKASLEEKEVLLREIHHRVKNNMQIVSSLLMLQSQNIADKKYKDIFIESQTRIHSMALIHEKLYQSENLAQINFKEYIKDIVSNIFESYCIKSNIKIDINLENIPITIDYAVPCGLIINELVTNSLKYAFPDGRQGKIQISLKSNTNNNMTQLSISDDGIGIAKDMDIRNTKSLGLHLVTALAEGQLHGKIILNRERGTEFQISFGAK